VDEGLDPGEVRIQVGYLAAPEPRRRIRFCAARVERPRTGRAEGEVVLEWNGVEAVGRLAGEASPSSELRLIAQATIDALQATVEVPLRLALVGAKATRVFDSDLVVVVLSPEGSSESLTGAALVRGDLYRACALAVLHATNRRLGNYLTVTD
jgi:hypothetical protein